MKTIPQIRKELLELASVSQQTGNLSASRKLKSLVKQLYRRKPVRRANKDSVTMTPELTERIRRFAMNNPNMSYKKIGNRFSVASGRVSEAVAGKRAA